MYFFLIFLWCFIISLFRWWIIKWYNRYKFIRIKEKFIKENLADDTSYIEKRLAEKGLEKMRNEIHPIPYSFMVSAILIFFGGVLNFLSLYYFVRDLWLIYTWYWLFWVSILLYTIWISFFLNWILCLRTNLWNYVKDWLYIGWILSIIFIIYSLSTMSFGHGRPFRPRRWFSLKNKEAYLTKSNTWNTIQ